MSEAALNPHCAIATAIDSRQFVPKYAAVFVFCRANAVSGGPDALHHLVHTLNELGAPAFVSYVPLGIASDVPEIYRRYYNVSTSQPIDAASNLFLFPEVMSRYIPQYQYANKAMWWLSVDNFFKCNGEAGKLRRREALYFLASGLGIRIRGARWSDLQDVTHYSPSAYATAFLQRHGIGSKPLHDPVNAIFLEQPQDRPRRDAIAFNPAKDMRYTKAVMTAFPDVDWIALDGMSHEEVAKTLGSVKVYLDFGHFPGRERIPTEAALCGACLVVAARGAAANDEDLMIPPYYKIDHRTEGFAIRTRQVVLDIFRNFAERTRDFDDFRAQRRQEPAIFSDEVIAEFCKNKNIREHTELT